MRTILPFMILVVGFAASVTSVQAQGTATNDLSEKAVDASASAGRIPRGGWDGNNLRIAVSRSKLIRSSTNINK